MSSRDAILHRIRTELSKSTSPERPEVPEVWPATGADTGTMVARFVEELEAVHGEVVRCSDMEDAGAKLVALMDESDWPSIGAVDTPPCRELVGSLPGERIGWVDQTWDKMQIAELSAGLVSADRLLADTGSCLVACPTGHERLMCYLPSASVVVARTGQLAEHLPAAWAEIADVAADPNVTGEHVIITGPSRTADIEKILILGVHGPKRLVVLLVEGD